MAHELELRENGTAYHVYTGSQKPWHGLGTEIRDDLTPVQVLEAAGLDWEVEKVPAYAYVGGKNVSVGRSALVRSSDNRVLDVVSDDWNPVQNLEAFEFFNDFIGAGNMKMDTAGSLKGGQIVWALAKIQDGFELFGGDRVESYLHFTNFHKYGFSTDVRFTPIRVVCNNTLTLSLNTKTEKFVKISHRRQFDGDTVKLALGVAADKLAKYKEMAQFLGSRRYTNENVVEFFNRLYPLAADAKKKEKSKAASEIFDIIDTQPGAGFAPGTWWNAYNAVSRYTDHLAGRNQDNRLHSAWYGHNAKVKKDALELAVEMANVSSDASTFVL